MSTGGLPTEELTYIRGNSGGILVGSLSVGLVDYHRSSEGGLDIIAVIQESPRQSRRQEEGGPSAAVTQERLSAITSATRGPHLQAEGGLDATTIPGATCKSRRLAVGGIIVACSQARNEQVRYFNAQQAHLECEIEKEFCLATTTDRAAAILQTWHQLMLLPLGYKRSSSTRC